MNDNIQEVIPPVVIALAIQKGIEIWTWAIRANGDVVIVAKDGRKFVFEKEQADVFENIKVSPPQSPPVIDSNWHSLVQESEAKQPRRKRS